MTKHIFLLFSGYGGAGYGAGEVCLLEFESGTKRFYIFKSFGQQEAWEEELVLVELELGLAAMDQVVLAQELDLDQVVLVQELVAMDQVVLAQELVALDQVVLAQELVAMDQVLLAQELVDSDQVKFSCTIRKVLIILLLAFNTMGYCRKTLTPDKQTHMNPS